MAGRLSLPAADVVVYVDGQKSEVAHAISVTQSAGGRSMDTATIRQELKSPVRNSSLVLDVQEVEIVIESARNNEGGGVTETARPIFWGKTSGAKISVSDNESLVFEARTMPCYFGKPIRGMPELNPLTGTTQLLEADVVFNPVVDGVTRGNMQPYGSGPGGHYIFLDPRRVYTDNARQYNTGSSQNVEPDGVFPGNADQMYRSDQFWTLKEAVYFLCWHLNGDQKNYRNPSRSDLSIFDVAQLPYAGRTDENGEDEGGEKPSRSSIDPLNPADADRVLRNVVLQIGDFLPEALDRLLAPFGYGWCVDYVSRGNRRLSFFRRGVGEQRKLKLQPPGETIDTSKSNLQAAGSGVGYQSLVNEVTVIGDNKLCESTFELIPAWSREYDSVTETHLTLGNTDYEDNPHYHRVWRDWVLNESGDYSGVKYEFTEFKCNPPMVPRCRRFLPCITLDRDKRPLGKNGYVVEFKIGDGDWQSVDKMREGSFEVLRHECGIRFNGVRPPVELWERAGATVDKPRVRITASVYSDERLSFTAKRSDRSVQPDIVPQIIDAGGKFKYRKVLPESQFAFASGAGYKSSEVDDTHRVKEMAVRLRDAWDQSDFSVSATIPWLDGEAYKLGEVVTGVEGRELDFDIHASAETKYPQIVGISFDCQQQKQILALESFRDTRFV